LIENFPQSELQAKFFIKNAVEPSKVFVLNCSKDICQERMFSIGQNSPNYVPSSILAKKIQNYYTAQKTLLPFL
jgi:hypothetical protein